MVKNPPVNAEDTGDSSLIPGLGKSPGGNDNPLQYSCLETSMGKGAWQTTVHGIAKNQTKLNATENTYTGSLAGIEDSNFAVSSSFYPLL